MADSQTTTTTTVEQTTTTTTEAPSTTTTTTKAPRRTTTTTTVDNRPDHERLAKQPLKEQSAEERGNDARALAFKNHAAEHADDGESYDSVTSRDKVEE